MKQRLLLILCLISLLLVLSGCRGTLQDIKATNPADGSVVFCDTSEGTDCYISFSVEAELEQNSFVCIYFALNRGKPDYWAEGGGPLETATNSTIWSMLSAGMSEGNPYNIPPFLVSVVMSDVSCVGNLP